MFGRQPQITCARILNYVKHCYAAWIAWALTWRGSHTTRALIQLSFSFFKIRLLWLRWANGSLLGWHRVICWQVELSIRHVWPLRRVEQIVKHWYRYQCSVALVSVPEHFWFYSRELHVRYSVSPTFNAGIGNLVWFFEASQAQRGRQRALEPLTLNGSCKRLINIDKASGSLFFKHI